ncbi:MAG: ABC transporter permease [Clostridiales bacterium]|nr:ABC transporter permease [Clostridiales bacterium]
MTLEKLKKSWKDPTFLAFVVLIVAWIGTMLFIPGFNTWNHNMTFLKTAAYVGMIVIGQGICIISGGIDLSVSNVVTLSSVVAAGCVKAGWGDGAAIVVALLASVLVGAINATGITFLRIPPIIMTLAMLSLLEGGLLIATDGTPPSGCGNAIKWLCKGKPLGVPNAVFVWIIFLVLALLLMNKSKFGRHIYAIGTNESAAKLNGVKVVVTKYMVYCLSSLCAGIGGLLILGNMGSTYLTIGQQYQLMSIAAVVIGGISIQGGKGKFTGIIAGTMLMILLRDILNVLKMSNAGREIFQGVLILAVLLAYGREKKSN